MSATVTYSGDAEATVTELAPPHKIMTGSDGRVGTAPSSRQGGDGRIRFEVVCKDLAVIPFSDLTIGPLLGQGGCGTVYKATWQHAPVAVKFLSKAHSVSVIQQFLAEISILSEKRHPNIVYYIGMCPEEEHVALITEFMPGGDLATLIHSSGLYLDLSHRIQLLMDVARALAYLHADEKPHRDIKPANILLSQDYSMAKLGDMGLTGAKTGKYAGFGTRLYMAPEVLLGAESDETSDMYSFGVVMYEVLTGRRPFHDTGYSKSKSKSKTRTRTASPTGTGTELRPRTRRRTGGPPRSRRANVYQMPGRIPASLPPRLAEALRACLDPERMRRPTANAVLEALSAAQEMETSQLESQLEARLQAAAAIRLQAAWRGRRERQVLHARGIPVKNVQRAPGALAIPSSLPYVEDHYLSGSTLRILDMRLDLLISRMTQPFASDADLVHTVLFTHPCFLPAPSLVDVLILRFSAPVAYPSPEREAHYADAVLPKLRLQVLALLKVWILEYPSGLGEDMDAATKLFGFLTDIVAGECGGERRRGGGSVRPSTLDVLQRARQAALSPNASSSSLDNSGVFSGLDDDRGTGGPSEVGHAVQLAAIELLDLLRAHQAGYLSQYTFSLHSFEVASRAPAVIGCIHKPRSLLDIHHLEVARQLTLLQYHYYFQIRPAELMDAAWKSRSASFRAPHVVSVLKCTEDIERLFQSEVLSLDDAESRAHAFCHALDVADACLDMASFSVALCVVRALTSPPIARLRQTLARVPGRYRERLARFEALFLVKAAAEYHSMLQHTKPPFLPALPIHLGELSLLHDKMETVQRRRFVNVAKMEAYTATISSILRFRTQRFLFRPNMMVAQFLEGAPKWEPERCHAISQALEADGASGGEVVCVEHAPRPMPFVQPLLEGLDEPRFLARLFQVMTVEHFDDGDRIVAEGEVGESMMFINRGQVRVTFSSGAAEKVLQEGDFFGEVALFLRVRRSASVFAVSSVELLVLSAERANELRAEFPVMDTYFGKLSQQRMAARLGADVLASSSGGGGSTRETSWMSRLATKIMQEAHDVRVPPEFVRALQARLVSRRFPDGEHVIVVGDTARSMYFVVEGAVEFEMGDGRMFLSDERAFFGELALFLDQPRSASVRAVGDVEALELTLEDTEAVMALYPKMRRQFVQVSQLRVSTGSRFRPPQWIRDVAAALRRNYLLTSAHPSSAALAAATSASAALVATTSAEAVSGAGPSSVAERRRQQLSRSSSGRGRSNSLSAPFLVDEQLSATDRMAPV
ncbi:TKL protein kinase [Thecamonas trahens ATCC 50062]|uniref:TKL protein kinase n=1 Tax=Thecamonas trahens ATCC 50062 TaxID=461836 RepID=A0A0L0D6Z6_THETB|nr:TKL protein kinase [Thecamonas trahens ATCC 50062]KNC47985.1 TKL protein kinase [Thecamonas trahens ATCC 50062]|eukprot:XP_013759002.1 TKL protein kinase [Thecamonas trahens ATCC 50062]